MTVIVGSNSVWQFSTANLLTCTVGEAAWRMLSLNSVAPATSSFSRSIFLLPTLVPELTVRYSPPTSACTEYLRMAWVAIQ